MLTADDFKSNSKVNIPEGSVDIFIENHIYPDFIEGCASTNVYINLIQQEDVNIKVLRDRLKELKFKIESGKIGVDDVLIIKVK